MRHNRRRILGEGSRRPMRKATGCIGMLGVVALLGLQPALAANKSAPLKVSSGGGAKAAKNHLKGRYTITKIEALGGNKDPYFRLHFQPVAADGPRANSPILTLETYHVHGALSEGMSLNIIAEVTAAAAGNSAASLAAEQILVYVPRAPQGEVPVWMVSRQAKGLMLDSTSYLKMHDPQSDFLIL